jgi:Spy/CpxP family protein refolding chaperone
MKSFLKTLLAAVVLGVAALPLTSVAQPPAGGPPGGPGGGGKKGGRGQQTPEQQITRLEEAVGTLSADVKTKITAIYTKLGTDMQAVAQEDRQTKGPELRTAANKEIRALLTPEQATKFDAMPQGGRGGGKKGN